jgi:predicted dehydrogenase
VFAGFDEVVKSPDIDAVVISSPPEFHKDQVIHSLQAGKSVLVEKPMCISRAEVLEIEETLEEIDSKPFLMVAENYYYKPVLKQIKRLLKSGCLGEIQCVRVRKEFIQTATGWKRNYGALLEGGIHFIAMISDIFYDAPIKVEARFPNTPNGDIERNSITKLTYGNDGTAELSYSWISKSLARGAFQHSKIIGENGYIIFESNGLYLFIKSTGKTGFYMPSMKDFMGFQAMTRDFVMCLENNLRTPYSDFHKAKRDLSIVFLAYESLSE